MNNYRKIEQLQKEIAALEAADKKGPMTFIEWEDEFASRYPNMSFVPSMCYAPSSIPLRLQADAWNPRGFFSGHNPVCLRGLRYSRIGKYAKGESYGAGILFEDMFARIVRMQKRSIFTVGSWRKYSSEVFSLVRNHFDRRRIYIHSRTLDSLRCRPYGNGYGDVGLDDGTPSFLLSGKLKMVCPSVLTTDYDARLSEIKDRANVMLQSVKMIDKLEALR